MECFVNRSCPIKSNAGDRGENIGYVYYNPADPPVIITVDENKLFDNWYPITSPNPWKSTKLQGWIKKTWVTPLNDEQDEIKLLVTVNLKTGEYSVRTV